MERIMGEKEWELHNEWLRKEELERYKLSVPIPTVGPKVPRVPDRKQEPASLGVSRVNVVVSKREFLVCAEGAPATAQ